MSTSPLELHKIRVLISPVPEGYAAECLDLATFTTEPTKETAAKSITELIESHILTGLEFGISFEQLRRHVPTQQVQDAYVRAQNFPPTQTLSPEVQALIRDIEYRVYRETITD